MITPIVQFFSDPLRLTLLVVGFFVLLAVFFISRRPRLSKTALAEENRAVHPSQYQDLPEERGALGKVSVRKAADHEMVMPKPKSTVKAFRRLEKEDELPSVKLHDDEDNVDDVGPVSVKKAPAPEVKKQQAPAAENKPRNEKKSEVVEKKVGSASSRPTPPANDKPKVTRPVVEVSKKNSEPMDEASVDAAETSDHAEPVVRVAERVKLSRDKTKKVITVYLKSDGGRKFGGRMFVSAMQEVGLELNDRGIYQHLAKDQSRVYVNFSVGNVTEAGNFDLQNIDEFSTNGLTFQMQVPMEVGNASLAFTQMMSAAQRLSRRLGGKLYTEDRKLLSVSEINVMRIDVEKYM
ncbi:MAG: hypothetical protein OEW58_03815 [Gammaproteobacteria bacterium]|nr:hypothetical protein [Gammaproteobacteria bacterium]